MNSLSNTGVRAGLAAALLFGAGTPFAKILLDDVSPWLLAGLLYTGSGLGLGLYRILLRTPRLKLQLSDYWPLGGAILARGLLGPVLLLAGLQHMPASGASLLLNAEGVFTALLAWIVFKENVDRRVAAGMAAIVAGALVLSFSAQASYGTAWPSLAVLAACLCWGIDNNLTRKVALNDATWLAAIKGGVAGPVNLVLAFAVGATLPPPAFVFSAMVLGFFAYGVSLVLFIVALRHVGTARAGAYFSVAPFFGGILALVLGENLTWSLIAAGLLMAVGIWLHLAEKHEHEHTHDALTHDHWHVHDEHHRHVHTHEPLEHIHRHFPDSHHRHRHGS